MLLCELMSQEYLDKIIAERLDGCKARVIELFQDESIIDELNQNARLSDWLHFDSKTYDGDYLVRHGTGFACYYQERGRAKPHKWFNNLKDAATCFFKDAGYLKNE
jgi:hypothetical protein